MKEKNCRYWEERIGQWLESSWNAENPELPVDTDLLEHAQVCPSCARKLQTAHLLSGKKCIDDDQMRTERVTQAVMRKILEHKHKKPGMSRWVLAAAAVAAFIIAVFVPPLRPGIPGGVQETTDFTAVILDVDVPDAQQVSVVGDWNNWDPEAQELKKSTNDTLWVIEMKLEKGREYRYQFVIDGEKWVPDPDAAIKIDDGFGGVNSVLVI
jgi:hypothetical protein